MKSSVTQYIIKTCPSNDNRALESLLNKMCSDGWELYTIQEAENENDEIVLNCIFSREYSPSEIPDLTNLFGFQTRMERIMSGKTEPVDICKDIQKKIKEKRARINAIKAQLDVTSEDKRGELNSEISVCLEELENLKKSLYNCMSPASMYDKIGGNKLTLALSEELAELVDPDKEINILTKIVEVRQNLTESLGYVLPEVRLENDDKLRENEFSVNVRGVCSVKTFCFPGFVMFFKDDLKDAKLPKDSITAVDPVTGKDIVWIEEEKCKDYWAQGLEAEDFVARILDYVAVKEVDEILSYSDITVYIEHVATENLFLVENVLPDFLSVSELKYLLSSLIRERVSVKDIVYIFEKINEIADLQKKEDILTALRRMLSRQITAGVTDEDGCVNIISLSEEALKSFDSSNADDENVLRIESAKAKDVVDKINEIAEKNEMPIRNIVVVTPPKYRLATFLVLSMFIPEIKVMSQDEISRDFDSKIIASV